MSVEYPKTWLREGRLFIRDGFIALEGGVRYDIHLGELHVIDGYLCLNGPPGPPYEGTERRTGAQRRTGRERRLGGE